MAIEFKIKLEGEKDTRGALAGITTSAKELDKATVDMIKNAQKASRETRNAMGGYTKMYHDAVRSASQFEKQTGRLRDAQGSFAKSANSIVSGNKASEKSFQELSSGIDDVRSGIDELNGTAKSMSNMLTSTSVRIKILTETISDMMNILIQSQKVIQMFVDILQQVAHTEILKKLSRLAHILSFISKMKGNKTMSAFYHYLAVALALVHDRVVALNNVLIKHAHILRIVGIEVQTQPSLYESMAAQVKNVGSTVVAVGSFLKAFTDILSFLKKTADKIFDPEFLSRASKMLYLLSLGARLKGFGGIANSISGLRDMVEQMKVFADKYQSFMKLTTNEKMEQAAKAIFADDLENIIKAAAGVGAIYYGLKKTGQQIVKNKKIMDEVKNIADEISGAFKNQGGAIRTTAKSFSDSASSIFKGVKDTSAKASSDIASGVSSAASETYRKAAKDASNFAKDFSSKSAGFKPYVPNIFDSKVYKSATESGEKVGRMFGDSFVKGVNNMKDGSVANVFKNVISNPNIAQSIVDGAGSLGSKAAGTIVLTIEKGIRAINFEKMMSAKSALSSQATKIPVVFNSSTQEQQRFLKSISKSLVVIFNEVNRETLNFSKLFKANIKDAFNSVPKSASSISDTVAKLDKNLKNGLFNTFESGGLTALASTTAIGTGLMVVGTHFSKLEGSAQRTFGVISLLIGTVMVGLFGAVSFGLKLLADGLISLGSRITGLMEKYIIKAQKYEKQLFTFQYTFQGLQKEVGDAMGSLDSWDETMNQLDRTTNKTIGDIQQATAELLLQGRYLGLNEREMVKLITRTADLSEITGGTLFDSMMDVLSALTGNSQAVQKYGMHLNEAGISHSQFVKENKLDIKTMNDQDKARVIYNVLLEQSAVIQGKAAQTTATMTSIMQQYEKSLERVAIKIAEQGNATRLLYIVASKVLTIISDFGFVLSSVIGTLIDLSGITLLVVGYLAKIASIMITVTTITAVATMLYNVFNYVLLSNVTVLGKVQLLMNTITASLGMQSIAVTTASSVWGGFAMIMRTIVISSFAAIPKFLMATVISIGEVTIAILKNPLFWKAVIIVGGIFLVIKALEKLQKDGKVFTNLLERLGKVWGETNDEIKNGAKQISIFQKALRGILFIATAFISAILMGVAAIVAVVLQAVKIILEAIISIADLINEDLAESLQSLQDKIVGTQDAFILFIDDTSTAIDDLYRVMFDYNAMAADGLDDQARGFEQLRETIDELDRVIIKATAENKSFTASFYEIAKAQKEIESASKSEKSTLAEMGRLRNDLYQKELQYQEALKGIVKDTSIADDLKKAKIGDSRAIADIKAIGDINLQSALKPLKDQLNDLLEIPEPDEEVVAAIAKLQRDINATTEKNQLETAQRIASEQTSINNKAQQLLETANDKIILDYQRQIEEVRKAKADGYLESEKLVELEKKLENSRGKALADAVDSTAKQVSESIRDKENQLEALYNKGLIDIEIYNEKASELENLRRSTEKDADKERNQSLGDSFGELIEMSKGMSDRIEKELSGVTIDPKNLEDSVKEIERVARLANKKLIAEIKKLESEYKATLDELEKEDFINKDEHSQELYRLRDTVEDVTDEMGQSFTDVFKRYKSEISSFFGDSEDDIKENAELLMDQLDKIELRAGTMKVEGVNPNDRSATEEDMYYGKKAFPDSGEGASDAYRYYLQFQKQQYQLEDQTRNVIDHIKGGKDKIIEAIFAENIIPKAYRLKWAQESQEMFAQTIENYPAKVENAWGNFFKTFKKMSSDGYEDYTLGRFFLDMPVKALKAFSATAGPVLSGLKTMWATIFSQQGWMSEILKFFGKSKKELVTVLAGVIEELPQMLLNVLENLPFVTSVFADFIGKFLVTFIQFIFSSDKLFVAIVESFLDASVAFVGSFFNALVENIISVLWNKVSGFFSKIAAYFTNMFDDGVKALKNVLLGLAIVLATMAAAALILSIAGVNLMAAGATIMANYTMQLIVASAGVFLIAFGIMQRGFKQFFKDLFGGIWDMLKNLWAWLIGADGRVQKRVDEYSSMVKQDEEDAAKREALDSYLSSYGDAEFTIKDAREVDEISKLDDYKKTVDDSLGETALNFADKTEGALSQAVLDGMTKGYAEFEKVNDFTIMVHFDAANVPKYAEGGFVGGNALVGGDSELNDVIPALLSPDEFVIPRSITKDHDKMEAIMAIMKGRGILKAAEGFTPQALQNMLRQMNQRGYTNNTGSITPSEAAAVQAANSEPEYIYETIDNDGGLPAALLKAFEGVKDMLAGIFIDIPVTIGKGVADGFTSIKEYFTGSNGFKKDISDAFTGVTDFFADLPNKIGDAVSTIGKEVKNLATKLIFAVSKLADNMSKGIVDFLFGSSESDKAKKAYAVLQVAIQLILGSLIVYGAAMVAVAAYNVAVAIAATVAEAALLLWNTAIIAWNVIVSIGNGIAIAASAAWSVLSSAIVVAASAIWAVLAPILLVIVVIAAVVAVIMLLVVYWEEIKAGFQWLLDMFKQIGSFFSSMDWSGVLDALATIDSFLGKADFSFFNDWLSAITDFFSTTDFGAVGTAFKAVLSTFKDIFGFSWVGNLDLGALGRSLVNTLFVEPFKNISIPNPFGSIWGKGTVESWLGVDIPFMSFADGGMVSGTAKVQGNSEKNDTIPAMLSAGEFVLDRETLMGGDSSIITRLQNDGLLNKEYIEPQNFGFGGWVKKTVGRVASAVKSGVQTAKGFFNFDFLKSIYNVLSSMVGGFSWTDFIADPIDYAKDALKGALPKIIPWQDFFGSLSFADGGYVGGSSSGATDSSAYDTVPAMLSRGEYVLPRSVAQNSGMMSQILDIIAGGSMSPMGIPSAQVPQAQKSFSMPTKIEITENKNVTIEVRSDSKVSIDGDDFKKKLLPEIKRALYEDSKQGKVIISERGVGK